MTLLDRFEEYLQNRKSALTAKNYTHTVERYLVFLKDKKPDELNAEQFLTYLGHKGSSTRSLNRHLAALRSFFKHVLRQDLDIEGYSFDKILPSWLDEEEQKKYIAACETPFERALAVTFLGSGIRVSEAESLLVADVDPKGFIKVMGKGRKERVVAVKPIVIRTVDEYLGCRKDHSNKVFPRGARAIEQIVKGIGERAKISKKVTPHVLRHSMGSLWMDKGGELAQLRDQLGHTNITTTSVYVHTKPERIRRSMPDLVEETYDEAHSGEATGR